MTDPDLQIRRGGVGGGGGAGHPDPEISGGPVSQKIFLGPWGFILVENKGEAGPLGPSSGSATGKKAQTLPGCIPHISHIAFKYMHI